METEKSMNVKNLVPGLVERGKIKIGRKGQERTSGGGNKFKLPTKLDHFLITKMVRGDDDNFILDTELHKILGEAPKTIPIRLLYDSIDLNFQSRYSMYKGTVVMCSGDGETGHGLMEDGSRDDRPCPCKFADPKNTGRDKCKINGTLSCIIDGAEVVGGVWKFRTTGYNSVVGIMSSLALIKRLTGGVLAGLPLNLVINPKTVANPVNGKAQTIYVVSIEYPGNVNQLKDAGYQIALEYKKHDMRIEHVEVEARKMIAPTATDFDQPADETVDEFYPDNREGVPEGEKVVMPDKSEPVKVASDKPAPALAAAGGETATAKKTNKKADKKTTAAGREKGAAAKAKAEKDKAKAKADVARERPETQPETPEPEKPKAEPSTPPEPEAPAQELEAAPEEKPAAGGPVDGSKQVDLF